MIPHHVPGDPIDSDTLMNIVYDNLRNNGDQVQWSCEGCGDDSRDGYKLAMKQFQIALDESALRAREKAIEEFTQMVRDFVPPTSDPTVYYGWRSCQVHLEEKLKSQPQ